MQVEREWPCICTNPFPLDVITSLPHFSIGNALCILFFKWEEIQVHTNIKREGEQQQQKKMFE